jgi:hypothetical protein
VTSDNDELEAPDDRKRHDDGPSQLLTDDSSDPRLSKVLWAQAPPSCQ